jgi:tetratricopeptide (TPR) repeat protein
LYAAGSAPPLAAAADVHFEEFDIAPAPSAPGSPPATDFGNETMRFSENDLPTALSAPPETSETRRATPLEGILPVESDFVSYEELGSLLDEEMQKAGETPPSPAAAAPANSLVDDQSLFADEQQFFNLAEELERELSDEAQPLAAPAMAGPEGEASLEEIFREFKKGVEQQLSPEDYETHFNLGIAYKEMGLIDEAIGEFQLASKDPARVVECCSMLGLCFLEKGMPQLAVKWYRKGLETANIKETESVGLLYDLACVYQLIGDTDLAYRTFLEVYGLNTNYRDTVSRVRELEAVKKN